MLETKRVIDLREVGGTEGGGTTDLSGVMSKLTQIQAALEGKATKADVVNAAMM